MTRFSLKNRLFLPLFLLLFVFAQACTKVDKSLGEDFIPDSQELKVEIIDATGFFTMQTVALDSLNTANFSTGTLGRIDDARLGKTSAGFITQFIPEEYGYAFEDGNTGLDSVFLVLSFASTYGKDATPMNIEVYEVTTALNDSGVFYGGDTAFVKRMVSSTKIGGATINTDSGGAYIKLANVNNLYGRLFNVSTADTFASSFKGLYVKVNDGNGGCIKYVDLVNTSTTNSYSALIGFYHYNDTVNSVLYRVYSSTPRFNVYKHDYKALTQSGDMLYMQGFGGVATKMTFNQNAVLAWASERHLAVNRAELILPVQDSTNASMLDLYSTQTYCMTKETDGYHAARDMFTITGVFNSAFDGIINRSQMRYTLNITHYFNDVLIKGKASPMLIVPYSYISDAKSIFISNVATRKPQLKITYGEIK